MVDDSVALGPLRREPLPRYGRWINDFGTIRVTNPPSGPVTAEKEQD